MRTLVAWLVVSPFVAWALIRGLGLERGYPAVALVAFTPYVAAGAVLAALVAAGLRRALPALLAFVSAVVLVAVVAPRAIGDGDRGGAAERPLRVLSANVFGGRTPPEELAAMVGRERVDVLSVQELTPALDAALRGVLPYRAARPAPGGRGTGLYARFPLELQPAPAARNAIAVAVGRAPGGGRLELTAVHPPAPVDEGNVRQWRAELGALPPARGGPGVRLLVGDFNATLDHRQLRRVLDRGYADAAERAGAGLRPTWPNGRRIPPEVTIDHVLVDARCAVTETRVFDLPRSDHRAVLAEIDLAPCL